MIKDIVYGIYELTTDFVMHLPLACLRNIWGKIVLQKMGRGTQLSRHVRLISPHKICIGQNVFINRNVTLDGRMGLVILNNTDVGEYSSIWSLQHDVNSSTHAVVGGGTLIEDHCWIAPHAIILPGRILKRGTVVATGSVVTKNFPEKSVIAGVPARFIKDRENDLTYELTYKNYF